MTTRLVTEDIWPQLTAAVRASRQPCDVAVAYFAAGASRQLPLPAGSRLVVDASERAVGSGQTCPEDLARLVKRGVRVFSVNNLHAKVFVLGRAAWIGSTNVSGRSASQLVEAAIRTTEKSAVGAARRFVRELCLQELTPTVLKRLATLYRPPRVLGGERRKRSAKGASNRPELPRLLIAQLLMKPMFEWEQETHESALRVARKRRKHPRSYELDSFRMSGKCAYQRGDVVIQVVDEGGGSVLVAPPGNVLHVRSRRNGNRQVSFVYLERPARRRRQVKALARTLGYGALKKLRRDGVVRDAAFAQALLNVWS